MSDSKADQVRTWKRFFARLRIPLLSAAGLVIFVVLTWFVLYISARWAVERELAKIRAKGEPTALEELTPASVGEEENAAAIFEQAFLELRIAEETISADVVLSDWDEFIYEDSQPFDARKVRRALELQRDALNLAQEALERPRCVFDLDYAAGCEVDLRHLLDLNKLARLFRARARLRLDEGRVEEASEEVDAMLRLALSLLGEPLLYSRGYAGRIGVMALEALHEIEGFVGMSQPHRRGTLSRLCALDLMRDMATLLVADRAMALDLAEGILSGRLGPGLSSLSCCFPRVLDRWKIRLFPFHFLWDKARLLRFMTELVEASRLPTWEALSRFEAVETRVRGSSEWCAPLTYFHLFAGAPPTYGRIVLAHARIILARFALACELFRSARGQYPERLEELAPEFLPEIPPDPFTGKPFVYKRKGKGFIVYSVGENLKDDGGAKDYAAGKDDISWEGGRRAQVPEAPLRASPGARSAD